MNRSLQYLLDTDMCIYLLNGNELVKARVAQVGIAPIGVAIPTEGELYFGAHNSARIEANLARVRAFLSAPGPTVLPIDDAAGRGSRHVLSMSTVTRLAPRFIGPLSSCCAWTLTGPALSWL